MDFETVFLVILAIVLSIAFVIGWWPHRCDVCKREYILTAQYGSMPDCECHRMK